MKLENERCMHDEVRIGAKTEPERLKTQKQKGSEDQSIVQQAKCFPHLKGETHTKLTSQPSKS